MKILLILWIMVQSWESTILMQFILLKANTPPNYLACDIVKAKKPDLARFFKFKGF